MDIYSEIGTIFWNLEEKKAIYFRYSRPRRVGTYVMRAKANVTRPLIDGLSPEVLAPYNQGAALG